MGGPLSTGILCKAPSFSFYPWDSSTILETQYVLHVFKHVFQASNEAIHPSLNWSFLWFNQSRRHEPKARSWCPSLRWSRPRANMSHEPSPGGWTDSKEGGITVLPSLKLTFSHLETDGWNTLEYCISCLLGPGLFAGVFWLVSGSVSKIHLPKRHQSLKIVRFVRESIWKTRWCFQILIIFTMTWGNDPI